MINVDYEDEFVKAAALNRRMMEGLAVSAERLRAFPLDARDVLISGYTKSGTNWLQVIVANLWDDWENLRVEKAVPNLAGQDAEGYRGNAACLAVGAPRLAKIHVSRYEMPDVWPENGKVIHITRNPKDVCVSLFYELRKLPRRRTEIAEMPRVEDKSFHVKRFVAGCVPWGPYLHNILSWRTFHHPNLLHVTYEEAKRDVRATIEKIVAFLGRPVEHGRIDEVIAKTDFKAMRNSDLRLQINHPDQGEDTSAPFMRKGIVGDWRNELSEADAELIDSCIVDPLERSGVFLDYG